MLLILLEERTVREGIPNVVYKAQSAVLLVRKKEVDKNLLEEANFV